MPDGLRDDAARRMAVLDIQPSPELIADLLGPPADIPPVAIPPPVVAASRARGKSMTLDTIRAKLVTRSYKLLHEPQVWERLREHLLSRDAKASLKAFEILFGALVSSTKDHVAPVGDISVQILNHIPGPELPSTS